MKNLVFTVTLFTGMATVAFADDWVGPQVSGVASPNGKILVRVVPGNSMGEVEGFADSPRGERAHALYYRLDGKEKLTLFQEVILENPVAPVFYVVTNQGAIVTFDNWHNVGMGKVIVIYSPAGKVLKSHTLTELYTKAEVAKMPRSVSSIWWRCRAEPISDHSYKVVFKDVLSNVVEVNPENGAVNKVGKHKGCESAA